MKDTYQVALVEDDKEIRDTLPFILSAAERFNCAQVFETAEEAINLQNAQWPPWDQPSGSQPIDIEVFVLAVF